MIALYSYEHIATFDQEVNYVWTNKWSLSTLIFVVNRYTALILQLYQTLAVATDYTVSVKPYSLF
jgi:hypothetical protein